MKEDDSTVGYQSEVKRHTGLKIAIVLGGMVAGLAFATQHFAQTYEYDPNLGFNIGGVYPPFMIVVWYIKWHLYYLDQLSTSASYGMFLSASITLTYLIISRYVTQSARSNTKLHGTAHWADKKEIKATGLLDSSEGVIVGGIKNDDETIRYLKDNGPSHVLCFAPTRSGKGVGLVLPTLLSWKQSAVISDLKGELWALTSGWRRNYANNYVFRFAPGEDKGTARWNPLEEVRVGTVKEVGDIRNIAEIIVDPQGKGLDEFWVNSGANLLDACITHVIYKGIRENLPANLKIVANMLTGMDPYNPSAPSKTLDEIFQEMATYPHYEDGTVHDLVASQANAMLNKPENERGSVISTMLSTMGIYRDPVVNMNTEKSDFKLMDLMNADKPASLYIITTPDNKDRLQPLLQLIVSMMVKVLAADIDYEDGRAVMMHKYRLLLMLDEFPSFGKLVPIAKGLAFIAGYGLKTYIITQDTVQLDEVYGEKNSIVSNCHIKVAFPPNRPETAKMLSDMLGDMTILERTFSVSGKRSAMVKGQVSETVQASKRPLLTPDEVMNMPGPRKNAAGDIVAPGEMIVKVAGAWPIRGVQPLYFLDDVFLARAKLPSPKSSDRLGFNEIASPVNIAVEEDE